MIEDIQQRRGFKPGGAKSKAGPPLTHRPKQAPDRDHDDYRLAFYKRSGRGKTPSGIQPLLMLNTPAYSAARTFFAAEASRYLASKKQFCQIERFREGEGWVDVTEEIKERW